MLTNLKNKVILITGAASGIGKYMAEKFAKYGSQVVLADLNLDTAKSIACDIQKQYDTQAIAVSMDVTDEIAVKNGINKAAQTLGKLDIAISNAGIQTISPIVEFDSNAFKRLVDIHLHGTFLITKYSMQQMIAQKTGGRILVTGSIHSIEASKDKSAYVAAKHAQLGLVRSIAKEGAKHNISSNLICPGFVRTPLVDKQIPEQAKSLDISEEQVIKNIMLGDTVDGEFTTLDDVANVALFLAAFETNALTGQHILVSHGIGM